MTVANVAGALAVFDATRANVSYSAQSRGCSSRVSGFHMWRGNSKIPDFAFPNLSAALLL
jgi:hypothetical protein